MKCSLISMQGVVVVKLIRLSWIQNDPHCIPLNIKISPEDGSTMFLRNGINLQGYTTLQPRRYSNLKIYALQGSQDIFCHWQLF